jgi:hypothetical protein
MSKSKPEVFPADGQQSPRLELGQRATTCPFVVSIFSRQGQRPSQDQPAGEKTSKYRVFRWLDGACLTRVGLLVASALGEISRLLRMPSPIRNMIGP